MNRIRLSCCCLCLAPCVAMAESPKVCDILASKVFDQTETNRSWNNFTTIKQTYCDERVDTYEKARALNVNSTVPIDGVMTELGFGNSERDYRDFRTSLCSGKDELYARQGWLSQKASTASGAILAVLQQCVSQRPFSMYLRGVNRDDRYFTWHISNAIRSTNPTQRIQLGIPEQVLCKDANGIVIEPGRVFEVDPSVKTFSCERRTCGSFQLSLSHTTHEIFPASIEVPAYSAPAPAPQPVRNVATTSAIGMNRQWSIDLKSINAGIEDSDSCTLVSAVGQWSCHHDDWSPACAHSCDPNVPGGAPALQIKGTVVHSGAYDSEYSDNNGACIYTFACTRTQALPPGPPLPAYCRS
ncbi:hypothetical protein [Massilia sp.]|uniref:hypothetical protein n=1 Tax=Massilia sp. TaxID=1882437 RepID=UPI00289C9F30|nr:hypothetical protein [Massilia sp.]